MRAAVVGHVEWVTFARVERMPVTGEIVHARDAFELPAGGGPVAAVQLAKLAGGCTFFTALGNDDLGRRALGELRAMGLRVEAAFRDEPQRRAFTHVDDPTGERTITVMGERLGPHASDPLPWDELASADAVYFCAGDDQALRRARQARVLVATAREAERLARVGVRLDAVVGSGRDPSERYVDIDPPPGLIVETLGAQGARYRTAYGGPGTQEAVPVERVVCAYGAGDSFAAGLTYGLAEGMGAPEAVAFAARCGAACLTGRGPYEGQLGIGAPS